MIRTSADMKKETRSDMRGGTGNVQITHLLEAGEMMGKARLCAVLSIPAGGSIGSHVHDPDAEIYIIISGQGRLDDNGVDRVVKTGDVVFTGGGESHAIYNTGAEAMELYAIVIE